MRFTDKKIAPYLFILPFLAIFLFFWIAPIFASFYYSLTEWNGISPPEFAGIKNYLKLSGDTDFFIAIKNTILAGIGYIGVLVPLALGIALVLNQKFLKLKPFFRLSFFIPVTVSLVVVALVFNLILLKEGGVLNSFLGFVGLPANIDWLGDQDVALWSIVLLRLWRATGYYAIIMLAGLQSISGELYEAAEMDGANKFHIVLNITIPLLKPVIIFVVVISTIWSFQLFTEPWILNQGGPNNATLTMVIYLYRNSFRYFKLGYGAAISYILTMLILGFSFMQMKLSGEME